MSEKKYLDSDTAYNAGTLSDWYISSVDDSDPIWTDAHIDELVNDFYVIPKDTPCADVVSKVHAHWITIYREDGTKADKCSRCGDGVKYFDYKYKWCPHCGAKMDESEESGNE